MTAFAPAERPDVGDELSSLEGPVPAPSEARVAVAPGGTLVIVPVPAAPACLSKTEQVSDCEVLFCWETAKPLKSQVALPKSCMLYY